MKFATRKGLHSNSHYLLNTITYRTCMVELEHVILLSYHAAKNGLTQDEITTNVECLLYTIRKLVTSKQKSIILGADLNINIDESIKKLISDYKGEVIVTGKSEKSGNSLNVLAIFSVEETNVWGYRNPSVKQTIGRDHNSLEACMIRFKTKHHKSTALKILKKLTYFKDCLYEIAKHINTLTVDQLAHFKLVYLSCDYI